MGYSEANLNFDSEFRAIRVFSGIPYLLFSKPLLARNVAWKLRGVLHTSNGTALLNRQPSDRQRAAETLPPKREKRLILSTKNIFK
jgi:hypothetical protein